MTRQRSRTNRNRQICIRSAVFALAVAWGSQGFAAQVVNLATTSRQPEGEKSTPDPGRAAITSAGRGGVLWLTPRFTYRAENRRLAEVLQDFAASQGLPAIIAEGIDGTVKGDFNSTPGAFLDALSKAYGLLWYHDGAALYFYPSSAIQSRLVRLKGFGRRQVTDLLQSLRLGDDRYPLRYSAADQTLLVYGPPRHVELVMAALDQLDAGVAERNQPVVRAVPLRYASAADRMVGAVNIPGLATTLNTLYAAGASARISPSGAAQAPSTTSTVPAPLSAADKVRPLPGSLGIGRSLQDLIGKRQQLPEVDALRTPPAPTARSHDDDWPVFRADEASNSVLVLGRPQRMAEYVELVSRLDVRPLMVEIEATIIDVSSDSVEALGVTWSASSDRANASVTPPGDAGLNSFRLTALWSNAGRELLSRIDALSAQGKATVVAKPKLLGVVSRPAVMKERRVVAVRVPGNLEANLFQIEAGTLLNVTPYVSMQESQTRIRLSLYIEDGGFEDREVDGVPVLKRTEIATEASILEGESVLVGGITSTVESTQSSGVPGLSKIPLFGGLFRSSSDKRVRNERLFLITPRIIRDAANKPAAGPIE